jgi:hypothetical protein
MELPRKLSYATQKHVLKEAAKQIFGSASQKLRPKAIELAKIRRQSRFPEQKDLAKECGVHPTTLHYMEKGEGKFLAIAFLCILSHLDPKKDYNWQDIAELPERGIEPIIKRLLPQLVPLIAKVNTLLPSKVPGPFADVRHIYSPLKVAEIGGDDQIEVNGLSDFPASACVIQGTPGQGKSVLLRYLAIREAETYSSLPIFIKLRDFKAKSVMDFISTTLVDWQVCRKPNEVSKFLRSGEISLFCDGFDEILNSSPGGIVEELAGLITRYPKLRIILSSRPKTQATAEPRFAQFATTRLKYADISRIAQKYGNDRELELIDSLPDICTFAIEEVIETPLLAVILLMQVRAKGAIPASALAFYQLVPYSLIELHNSADGVQKKPLQSGLTPIELCDVFCAFCFVVVRDYGLTIPLMTALGGIVDDVVSNHVKVRCSGQLALHDLRAVAGLIFDEAGYCGFAHAAIKNFCAASWIARMPEDLAANILSVAVWSSKSWSFALHFLHHIDRARFERAINNWTMQENAPFDINRILSDWTLLNVFINKYGALSVLIQLRDSTFDVSFCFPPNAVSFGELFGTLWGARVEAHFQRNAAMSIEKSWIDAQAMPPLEINIELIKKYHNFPWLRRLGRK